MSLSRNSPCDSVVYNCAYSSEFHMQSFHRISETFIYAFYQYKCYVELLTLFVICQTQQFFYETLMGRKQGECYCSSGHTKCWWHGLKNVKVTSSLKTDENVDFKAMLDALPTYAAQEDISFRLEF